MVPEITSFHEMHNQIEVILILEGVEHVDDEPVSEYGQKLSLVEYAINTSLRNNSE